MRHGCEALLNGETIAQARHQFGLFILNLWEDREIAIKSYLTRYTTPQNNQANIPALPAYRTTNSAIKQLWHRRIGHIGIQNLRKL
jgi:hypothetical protein